jgi:hypothetical protein
MSSADIEQRVHRRVEFFLVPAEREQVPVWIFKPADVVDAFAGLVLNLSDGGLQVLTGPEEALDVSSYEIQLLLGEDATVARFRGVVTRVWTRTARTIGQLSGFRFDDRRSSAEDFIRVYQSSSSEPRWVRCVLLPRS